MKKMDEMEIYIALKSVRIAWVYTVIFLFVWVGINVFTTSELGLAFILLVSQNIVLLLSQLILKRRME